MKTKPELSNAAGLNLETWRGQEPEKVDNRTDGRDIRITKTVRMKLRFSEMLRDEAYRRTIESGTKVAEADLIEEALTDWQIKNRVRAD